MKPYHNSSQLEKFRDNIVLGEKTSAELYALLTERFTLVEMDTQDIDQKLLACHRRTAEFATTNSQRISANELDFIVLKLVRDNKSNPYYTKFDMNNQPQGGEWIYIVLEKKTAYLYSNCNELFLQLMIERGIDKKDLFEQNEKLDAYLSYLHLYFDEES